MYSAALSIGLVWDGSFGEVASGGLPGTFRLSKSPASKMAAAPNEKIRFMVVGFAELNFMSSCRAFEVYLPGVHCGLSHSDGVRESRVEGGVSVFCGGVSESLCGVMGGGPKGRFRIGSDFLR